MSGVKPPKTRYAKSGEVHVAYQCIGQGPVDFVLAPGFISNLDVYWESPDLATWFQEIALFARLILFDKRGTGLSDRSVGVPTLEDRSDDIRAVMDAVDSRRAVLFGLSEGATMCALFGATHPERTLGLILLGGSAKDAWAPDYPWGQTSEAFERGLARLEADWDRAFESLAEWLAPDRASDPEFQAWVGRLVRYSITPDAEIARRRMNREMDIRSILPGIRVPTLILHATDDRMVSLEEGRYLARSIPTARLVEYPSSDHLFVANAAARTFVTREIRTFVEGLQTTPPSNRVLTTILFADIVGSTEHAVKLGDQEWGSLLGRCLTASGQAIALYQGREVKKLGDGLLATFDGPTRAVRCALEIRDTAKVLGLEMRLGVHTGECVLKDNDIEGIAVHLASRVMAKAAPGEVLTSATVHDLSAGSGVRFVDRGLRALKGVNGRWRLYSAGPPVGRPNPEFDGSRSGRRGAP